jgi:RNA polymerase sigma-70 factor, ECF subfamily
MSGEMSTREVVEGYRTATAEAGRESALAPVLLEAVLGRLYLEGCAEHPEIRLNPSIFGTHIAGCNTPLTDQVGTLPAGDLFLACAALSGDQKAISKLRQLSLPPIRSYLRRVELPASTLDDITQELWNVLFSGGTDRVPRLARYSGTGSLRSFIGITARRLALMRCRHESVAARAIARAAAEVNALADDIELGYIKTQYRDDFRRSIEDALRGLDDRLRMVLRMRVVEDMTVDGIARTYGVAQSTVSRWLDKAREQVVSETRRLVCEGLALSGHEFDSLWRLVASQLEVSVSGILACNGVSHSAAS